FLVLARPSCKGHALPNEFGNALLQVTGSKLIDLFTEKLAIVISEEWIDIGSALAEGDRLIADQIHQLLGAWNSAIEELLDIGE
ncbi:MAG: hypothetical protein WA672_00590, partial [Candidatus Angelobacter sp.]